MGFCIDGLVEDEDHKGCAFFCNISYWHPLASYILAFAGSCLDPDEKLWWHSNDGQYVCRKHARKIGKKLLMLIHEGHTKECEEEAAKESCAFKTEVVRDFAVFCLHCNGFMICYRGSNVRWP